MREDSSNSTKRASEVAGMIGQRIVDEGWQVGAFLGTEADLVKQYGVGRWTMRDAIAIAERDGLVERRRGHGGGLFVAAPAGAAVSAAIRNYLEFAHVRVEDVMTAYDILAELAFSLASQRITDAQVAELRAISKRAQAHDGEAFVDISAELQSEILNASHNTILKVFVESLSQLLNLAGLYSKLSNKVYMQTLRELVAIRIEEAECVIGEHLRRVNSLLSQHRVLSEKILGSTQIVHSHALSAGKRDRAQAVMPSLVRGTRSEQIARQLQAEIVSSEWPEGHHVGTESELAERYNVSRLVLREVVRVLEELGVVEMRTGHHSGLKVSSPRPEVVIRKATAFLLYAAVTREDVYVVRSTLEITLVEAMAKSLRNDEIGAALRAAAESGISTDSKAIAHWIMQFYKRFLDCSENPVIVLLLRILSELFLERRSSSNREKLNSSTVAAIRARQLAVADAVAAGDPALARRALSRLRVELKRFELDYKGAVRVRTSPKIN